MIWKNPNAKSEKNFFSTGNFNEETNNKKELTYSLKEIKTGIKKILKLKKVDNLEKDLVESQSVLKNNEILDLLKENNASQSLNFLKKTLTEDNYKLLMRILKQKKEKAKKVKQKISLDEALKRYNVDQ